MGNLPMRSFDCQIYVPARGPVKYSLPSEPGPVQVIRFQPLAYEELIDPAFRRLLANFNRLTALSS